MIHIVKRLREIKVDSVNVEARFKDVDNSIIVDKKFTDTGASLIFFWKKSSSPFSWKSIQPPKKTLSPLFSFIVTNLRTKEI